ncbi:hypothetical protein [Pedobacter roseus]|jgi:hypothetical protein|uniref:DUF3300 domain-containing protein n=1 Tax=Pedobacter roseus TaxID=336820 RepID=A0A7G9QMG6_9SPHI|nr:hypothetical protein [Pedobacter roseus]QNN44541.1 hypothetical protein H9L23_10900 [Pedobacter roseus]
MKKLFIISAILGIVALTSNQSNAQVSINLNIGAQPAWVPAGYQSVDYYYLPEVQSYYYVPQRQFVYLNGNRWTRSRYLPARYRGYDLHHGRKIVMYGNNPYRNYNSHRVTYASRTNYYRSSYGGGDRIRYRAPRNNYRSYRVDNRHHDRRVNPSLFSRGHREKHGRH